ncbi:hypothetical protein [Novosphingobium malaysiense]|uniref:CsbD-like domain-containing protein n=1 Tax=Novosphingobium malaysiense TaxID=1348853 RepID=A0A0B1ZPE5_9SPHN|nr:hypothetical protein [Novosphingobium malaysiense]KHK91103.1 hypothetical protein LK12_09315 [Novosphingobium malaysiense]
MLCFKRHTGDVKMNLKTKALKDQAMGKAKRALGELSARPDYVLEGERQDAKGRHEADTARDQSRGRSTPKPQD